MTQPSERRYDHCHANECSSSQDSLVLRRAVRLLGTGNGGLLGAAGTTLAGGKVLAGLTGDLLGGLLDNLGALGEDHLDVAGVGHVGVDLE